MDKILYSMLYFMNAVLMHSDSDVTLDVLLMGDIVTVVGHWYSRQFHTRVVEWFDYIIVPNGVNCPDWYDGSIVNCVISHKGLLKLANIALAKALKEG